MVQFANLRFANNDSNTNCYINNPANNRVIARWNTCGNGGTVEIIFSIAYQKS
ncbi:MAG: hypothetical protein IT223_07575 [Crocinitomicaceae bacterium]|nr:hypothetical protein [Crocinitomicaceae bacterium]